MDMRNKRDDLEVSSESKHKNAPEGASLEGKRDDAAVRLEKRDDSEVCLDWRLSWRARKAALVRALARPVDASQYAWHFRLTNLVGELIEQDEADLLRLCLGRCGDFICLDSWDLCKCRSREVVRTILAQKVCVLSHFSVTSARSLSAVEGFVIDGGMDVDARPNGYFALTLLETVLTTVGREQTPGPVALAEAKSQPIACAVRLVFLGASLFKNKNGDVKLAEGLELIRQKTTTVCGDMLQALVNTCLPERPYRTSNPLFATAECCAMLKAITDACSDRRKHMRSILDSYILTELHAIVADFYDIKPTVIAPIQKTNLVKPASDV